MPKAVKARPVAKAVVEISNTVEKMYTVARKIYDYQDDITREAIDAIADRLLLAATGVIKLNGSPYQLDQEIVKKNTFFLAVEIVKDLALYDIQVAGFKFHPDLCAQCNTNTRLRKKMKVQKPQFQDI